MNDEYEEIRNDRGELVVLAAVRPYSDDGSFPLYTLSWEQWERRSAGTYLSRDRRFDP
jgi:hypothetical protein